MTGIITTIVIVSIILVVDFVVVIFIEDKRRKKRRRKAKREVEKADLFTSDLLAEDDDFDREEFLTEQDLEEEEAWTNQRESVKEKCQAEHERLCEENKEETIEQEGECKENCEGKRESVLDEEKSMEQDTSTEEVFSGGNDTSVIRINDVTMKFRISTSSASGLKDFMIQKMKRQISTRDLVALDHVSFEVLKGEVVGIIGTNGSGKSTLLKIVAGALEPSEGTVTVDKKKVQMLSLGAGFDTELSARENVYLNGAIIGYSKEFISSNYDKIVEFSELEGFMDEKVKNFSSGMVSRLAFAIATMGDAAEILILDEVLSVGDEFFRKKSLARVKEMIHGGSTVLMVSHGMSTILENCTKVVWIEKGKLQMVGDARIVCAAYRNYYN